MRDTPKGMRPHIVLAGRRNAGKSSLLNAISGQNAAIVSANPGTTTDPVEKTMELLPYGPVVFIDTAGIDDIGGLGKMRIERSINAAALADMAIIATDGCQWGDAENFLVDYFTRLKIPFLIARNKIDKDDSNSVSFPAGIAVVPVSAKSGQGIDNLRKIICEKLSQGQTDNKFLVSDLLPESGLAVLVVPIDSGAPKGRLILPQAQTIRDCMDNGKFCMVTTDRTYPQIWKELAGKPDLVVCDSQVVREVAAQTPKDIKLTTFSILMARYKGDLVMFAKGARKLGQLKPGARVLVQEACSHHPQKDDIGRVKIPALLRKISGGDLEISFAAGRNMPLEDTECDLVIHCGGCMLTSAQMARRQNFSEKKGCPMTNYGIAISYAQGVLDRALEPFPEAKAAFGGGNVESV